MGVSHYGVLWDHYNGNVSHKKRVKFDRTKVHDKKKETGGNLKSDRTQVQDNSLRKNKKKQSDRTEEQ